ncbi:hypothetical protein [Herpetosiphon gulosus]|uniref:PrcB C-terminal domain-containing protein n=1 Tax=Herpetosiphon gulosus TaxID=1973496 RepID=A0ABP9WV14_9CHLR
MRFRKLLIGLLIGGLMAACGNQASLSPTDSPTPTDRPAPTERSVQVTVTNLDAEELESLFEFASAKEPIVKGEILAMASTNISFSFEVLEFVRGEQALATIATLDPAYAGPPNGYELGLVRAVINHGNVHAEPVVLDGTLISLLVLTNGEYQALKDQQGLPCCIEPRFDTPVAKADRVEIYFPILVAADDPNPLLVINRDGSDNADASHFALQ